MTLKKESRPDKAEERDAFIYLVNYRYVRRIADFSSSAYFGMITDCSLQGGLKE